MKKILFIDRDGTLIKEPEDFQVDSLAKVNLVEEVIPSLLRLKALGYSFVMITNQDGLGTEGYPKKSFDLVQSFLEKQLNSQGVVFDDVLVCPHFESDNCFCRKPNVGLVVNYLKDRNIDFNSSYVIGDRDSDRLLAKNMGIDFIRIADKRTSNGIGTWADAVAQIEGKERSYEVTRRTKETEIYGAVNLDSGYRSEIRTGLPFFDHMLDQIAKHANISIKLEARGDLEVDDHHTVEDTAIVLGEAIKGALSDKARIERYGFLLPMDESSSQIAIDLSGRPYLVFEGDFAGEYVGNLKVEMVKHFFQSLSISLGATIQISVKGENSHHMVESCFKSFARCIKQAITQVDGLGLPSTKGVL